MIGKNVADSADNTAVPRDPHKIPKMYRAYKLQQFLVPTSLPPKSSIPPVQRIFFAPNSLPPNSKMYILNQAPIEKQLSGIFGGPVYFTKKQSK